MHPQLATLVPPGEAALADMLRRQVEPGQALFELGALHSGRGPGLEPFRTVPVGAGGSACPHPDAVPELMALLFERVRIELGRCKDMVDDVALAVLLAYGTLAVHPFENGNGRTALDLAHYFLRARWRSEPRLLELPSDAHRTLASVLLPIIPRNAGETAEHYLELREAVARQLGSATLEHLHREPAFVTATRWMVAHLNLRGNP